MKLQFIFFCCAVIALASCTEVPVIEGFWEGPHPEDANKKFYVHLSKTDDKYSAHGYWTENNFYSSEFDIEQLKHWGDSISFFIPNWQCTYSGAVRNNTISGGFSCPNEPFDPVDLILNNTAADYLVYPLPKCAGDNFTYEPAAKNMNANETAFIKNVVNKIIQNEFGRITSFLVSKKGKTLCEEYFYGYTNNTLRPIESCTKSITSLLVGLACDKGFIQNLHQPICEIFPEYPALKQGNYQKITIEHLLTMSAGFKVDDRTVFSSGNRINSALIRELTAAPGEKFQYDGGSTEILGAILKKKTGMFADEFAKHYLFQPLKINNYNWDVFKQNGCPSMAGSLELLPADMLKIGNLILHKGRFEGNQVISEKWIEVSTSKKISTHIESDNYAYQWWNIQLGTNEKKYPVIWANGWGSQFIYVIPELDVVIACTGYNYEQDSWAISGGIGKHLHLLE